MESSYLREKEIGTRIDVLRSVSQALEGSMSGYHYDYYQDHIVSHQSGGDLEDKGSSEVKFFVDYPS